jgi:hypothetical protein
MNEIERSNHLKLHTLNTFQSRGIFHTYPFLIEISTLCVRVCIHVFLMAVTNMSQLVSSEGKQALICVKDLLLT